MGESVCAGDGTGARASGATGSGARGQFWGTGVCGACGEIASEAEFLPRNVQTKSDREHEVFGVKVYVDNAQQVLKSGMSATVRLE